MPIVPRAQKQARPDPLPDTRQSEQAPGGRGMEMLANAQVNLGQTIRREALAFGEIAIKKQQEVDRLELGKIKAEWDANLLTILNEEERDPDYEGMNDRISKRINEYNADLKKRVNGRISKYVDNMISYNTAGLAPKVQEMYIKKQDDRAVSNAMTASVQFEDNGDYESAMAVWDGVTGMSEAERTEKKNGIESRQNKAVLYSKVKELYSSVGGDYGRAAEYIAGNVPENEQKQFRTEFASYWTEMNKINEIKYKETNDKLSDIYLKQNNLGGVDIQSLVKKGELDSDSAIRWRNIIESDRDRALARMERNAVRADRLEEKKFREEYKHAVPLDKEFMEYEHYYGMPKNVLNKNYLEASGMAAKGELSLMDIATLVNTGQIIRTHAAMLEYTVKGHASQKEKIYSGALSDGRSYINSLINKLEISEAIKNEIKVRYDYETTYNSYKPEDLTGVAARVIKERLSQDDIKKKSLFIFDTDVNDLLKGDLDEIAGAVPPKDTENVTAGKTKVPAQPRQDELKKILGLTE